MSAGIIQFACPTCRKLQSAPSTAAGQSLRCPFCHNVFVIPVVAVRPAVFAPFPMPSPTPTNSPAIGPHAAVIAPLARPIRPQSAPAPAATPRVDITINEGGSGKEDDTDGGRSRVTPWIGMAFMGVAGLAMLVGTVIALQVARGKLKLPKWEMTDARIVKERTAQSVETEETPASSQEFVEGNEEPVNEERKLSPYELNLQKIEAAERERIANRNSGVATNGSGVRTVQLDPKTVGRIKWEDAREVTVVMNRVKVKVDRIEIGVVMGRDASNTVVPVDRRSYLSVFLTLQNVGDFPLEYHTWYREGGSAKSRHKPATVQDNLGRSYPVRTFQGFKRLRGASSIEKLAPHEEIQDVVVFEHPAGSMEEVKYFMLSLPASAYGGEGTYRFEVPMEMMKGW